jgi:acetyl/propionyl-CoA carboxylase alpha subunit
MRRALTEYLIVGIRTTVPFFTWLMTQPDFLAGRFHTTYLDEVLRARNGRSFVEPQPEAEEVAAIAAALQMVMSPSAASASRGAQDGAQAVVRRWKAEARSGGLR